MCWGVEGWQCCVVALVVLVLAVDAVGYWWDSYRQVLQRSHSHLRSFQVVVELAVVAVVVLAGELAVAVLVVAELAAAVVELAAAAAAVVLAAAAVVLAAVALAAAVVKSQDEIADVADALFEKDDRHWPGVVQEETQ